jgi:two-component system NtrC family response regulator
VRELIHALENAIIAAQHDPALFPKHLPTYIRVWLTRTSVGMDAMHDKKAPPVIEASGTFLKLKDVREIALANTEKQYLKDLLIVARNDVRTACRLSGLSRTRLYVLLKKHKISIHGQS